MSANPRAQALAAEGYAMKIFDDDQSVDVFRVADRRVRLPKGAVRIKSWPDGISGAHLEAVLEAERRGLKPDRCPEMGA